VLSGVITIKTFIWGTHALKLSHFGAGIEISSLNVMSNNFRTAKQIFVIHSSNDAAPRMKFGYMGQTAKICF
jgi:hypothetical protein